MEKEATTTNLDTIALEPRQTSKDKFLVALVPMPDSIGQKEGTVNRLKIEVRYIKDGIGRAPRGIYLTIQGETYDGTFVSFLLAQDPNEAMLLTTCGRLSQKALNKAVDEVPNHMDAIMSVVREAREYYATRKAH